MLLFFSVCCVMVGVSSGGVLVMLLCLVSVW